MIIDRHSLSENVPKFFILRHKIYIFMFLFRSLFLSTIMAVPEIYGLKVKNPKAVQDLVAVFFIHYFSFFSTLSAVLSKNIIQCYAMLFGQIYFAIYCYLSVIYTNYLTGSQIAIFSLPIPISYFIQCLSLYNFIRSFKEYFWIDVFKKIGIRDSEMVLYYYRSALKSSAYFLFLTSIIITNYLLKTYSILQKPISYYYLGILAFDLLSILAIFTNVERESLIQRCIAFSLVTIKIGLLIISLGLVMFDSKLSQKVKNQRLFIKHYFFLIGVTLIFTYYLVMDTILMQSSKKIVSRKSESDLVKIE